MTLVRVNDSSGSSSKVEDEYDDMVYYATVFSSHHAYERLRAVATPGLVLRVDALISKTVFEEIFIKILLLDVIHVGEESGQAVEEPGQAAKKQKLDSEDQ